MLRRALLAGAALLALSTPASAFERQHHLGVGPDLGMLKVADKSTLSVGAGLGLHYAYGLTDQFNLMAEAGSTIVALDQQQDTPDAPRTRPARVDCFGLGVGYVIDILRWVPYVGVMAGGYGFSGGTIERYHPAVGAQLALGLDYQLDRSFAIGVAARQHLVFSEKTYPSFTTFFLRAEYIWGW